MKNISILLVVLLFGTLQLSAQKTGWLPLFNGKNLSGWSPVGGKATYHVENGSIVGTSVTKTPNTFLKSKKPYGDFILEYEVKMDPGLNSGVQFRSLQYDKKRDSRLYGYQVECEDSGRGWAGGIYDEGRSGWLYPVEYNPEAKGIFKKGEWNKFRIEAIGDRIRSFLNGKPVADLLVDLTDEGYIGLQVHAIGNNNAFERKRIRWKNIRIITKNPQQYVLPEYGTKQVNFLKNVLTETEKKEGWELLWDGKTTSGWRSAKGNTFPTNGWKIEDNRLIVEPSDGRESTNGGDIITVDKYKDFVLEVDFKITKGANSGIKYFVDPNQNKGAGSSIGCEFQILDDRNHLDAKKGLDGNRTLGSLYDLIPANGKLHSPHFQKKRFFGVGTWNRARIEVRGSHVKHFLNSELVVEYERGTQQWKALVAYSKYKNWPNFGELEEGHILLQDHGNQVFYRNIKIKKLDDKTKQAL